MSLDRCDFHRLSEAVHIVNTIIHADDYRLIIEGDLLDAIEKLRAVQDGIDTEHE